jgi:hypothetical protein
MGGHDIGQAEVATQEGLERTQRLQGTDAVLEYRFGLVKRRLAARATKKQFTIVPARRYRAPTPS